MFQVGCFFLPLLLRLRLLLLPSCLLVRRRRRRRHRRLPCNPSPKMEWSPAAKLLSSSRLSGSQGFAPRVTARPVLRLGHPRLTAR
ncbi:hypothetical protein K456DRAFT_46725 [Colletotrichum gloeosporioides 23]|nr:hypothetical protein K456DRAFT_46725 [Colletotrichum gloeosporioides 23]